MSGTRILSFLAILSATGLLIALLVFKSLRDSAGGVLSIGLVSVALAALIFFQPEVQEIVYRGKRTKKLERMERRRRSSQLLEDQWREREAQAQTILAERQSEMNERGLAIPEFGTPPLAPTVGRNRGNSQTANGSGTD